MWVFYRTYQLNESIFVGSQTWSTTEGVQFKAIIDLMAQLGLKEDRDYTFNKKILEIKFINRKGRIKGCCSAAKKSIEGYTKFDGAWFDEASNWDEEVKNYVMGRCRGKRNDGTLIEPRYRYTGTPPLSPSGWYYNWLVANPTKYVRASTIEGVGKYLSQTFYDQQVSAWGGPDAPLTKIMVYGELPDENSSTSIFRREHTPVSIQVSMGLDCSGGNNGDEAYFTISNGIDILNETAMKEFTQKELLSRAIELIGTYNVKSVRIDATGGYGIGIIESLKDKYPSLSIEGINFGQSAVDKNSYVNARAEMYVNLARRWNDAWGNKYFTERMATILKNNTSGKIQLIEKEQISKAIGHSPDGLDSLALALYNTKEEHTYNINKIPTADLKNMLSGFNIW